MGQRGYADSFFSHYFKNSGVETRLQKAWKISELMRLFRNDLQTLDCLDVGCSSGVISTNLRSGFKSMVGIDYDLDGLRLINEAQKERVQFIRGDAMVMPFSDNSFGAVICAQVYEHVPDDRQLFEEIKRVIKPGGIVFFSGPNKIYPIEPHYFIPFLHWLPQEVAGKILRWLRKAEVFDIRSRTFWSLRKVLSSFEIFDMTFPLLQVSIKKKGNAAGGTLSFLLRLLRPLIKVFIPFNPNFNWILKSPGSGVNSGQFHVMD